ncbi:MAG: PGPGW domain-containing protein [Verrucomicrobiae bacterium]|nr:PGPGW domain-containing protein [Verrucomicrobiae bacterium]
MRISVGVALSLVGIALLVLPGPGIPLILFGLTILAADFVWARRLKRRLCREAIRATRRWRHNRHEPPPTNPPTPPAAQT